MKKIYSLSLQQAALLREAPVTNTPNARSSQS